MNTTRTKMKKQKTGSVCVQSFNSTIVCIERKMMTMKQCRLSEMLDENQNERKTVPCLNSSSYITFDLSLDQFLQLSIIHGQLSFNNDCESRRTKVGSFVFQHTWNCKRKSREVTHKGYTHTLSITIALEQ